MIWAVDMKLSKRQLRRIIREELTRRNPATYAEAKKWLEVTFNEYVEDYELRMNPALAPVLAALDAGQDHPDVTDRNSPFRQAWDALEEEASTSGDYGYSRMLEWFLTGTFDQMGNIAEGGAMGHYEPQKKRSYHQISGSMMSLANAVKRKFLKLYDAEVRIDGRQGWITVNGKKAVNISSASGKPLSMEDMLSQMEDAMWGPNGAPDS
jgi:hypothetical protein